MQQLVSALLAGVVLASLVVSMTHRFEDSMRRTALNSVVFQCARQQVSFARAVLTYITANSVPPGTSLTPAMLEVSGDLSSGFPGVNPLGQVPIAYAGTAGSALVTYTTEPNQFHLAPYGLSVSSSLDLQSLALSEATTISAMEAGFPKLIGAMLNNGSLTTPDASMSVVASSFFTGVALPSGPVFADLVNVVPTAPTSNPSPSNYGVVTGD